jgi:hypothetical protein
MSAYSHQQLDLIERALRLMACHGFARASGAEFDFPVSTDEAEAASTMADALDHPESWPRKAAPPTQEPAP